MRISDWSSDVCSSDLDPVAIVADHIGPEHSTDPAIMDGCRNKGLAPPERGPVEPLEQPFFAAEDQILGLDMNNSPARVAAHDLGTDDPDPAAPAPTSEEGRVGEEWGSTCRARWPTCH